MYNTDGIRLKECEHQICNRCFETKLNKAIENKRNPICGINICMFVFFYIFFFKVLHWV